MRVSIIGPAYPLRGGIAHHVYWLGRELTSRGHDIQVISFRKLYPRFLFPGTTEFDSSRLKLDAGAEALLTAWNPATWLRAMKRVQAFQPDAVVFQWWQPFFGPLVGTLARKLRRSGILCAIECHNVLPHERSPLDSVLVKYAFSPADRLIAHSKKDRDALLAFLPGKDVRVATLPILGEFSAPAASERSGSTMLFFGKVRKYKGLEVLLAAMPRAIAALKTQSRDLQLLITGEFYDSLEKYRERIRELGIESHVRIDDRYIPNEEVATIFQQADVLVLPYTSASQSGVARIAFSNSLPVIASTAGGLSEDVKENVNGLLFPVGDSDALADRIVSYFSGKLGPKFSRNLRSASEESNRLAGDVIEETLLSSRAAEACSRVS